MTSLAGTRTHANAARDGAVRAFSYALLGIAGWADAVGFLTFSQLYISFMSGDATQLGVSSGFLKTDLAIKLLATQVIFAFGAALGREARLSAPKYSRRILLACYAVLLGLMAALGSGAAAAFSFALAVFAMSAQNAILHKAAGVPVGSMITGALARLGENICDRLHRRPAPISENFGQWVAFIVAALAGTLGYRFSGGAAFLGAFPS